MSSAFVRMLFVVWIASFSLVTRATDHTAERSHEININALTALAGARDIGYQYSINRYVGVVVQGLWATSLGAVSTRSSLEMFKTGIVFSLPVRDYQSAYLSAGKASYKRAYEFDTGAPGVTYSGQGSFVGVGYRWSMPDDHFAVSAELGKVYVDQYDVALPSGGTETSGPRNYFGVRLGWTW